MKNKITQFFSKKDYDFYQDKKLGSELIAEKGSNIKAIFMHIHKCAGTSVISAIEKNHSVISCVARPGDFPIRTSIDYIPKQVWENSIKFTFVRNPYYRIASAYKMFMQTHEWKLIFPEFLDFVEFLEWTDLDHHQVKEFIPNEIYVHKIDNLIHHCSSFKNPKYQVEHMDFIGKVETLNDDILNLKNNFDITLEIETLRMQEQSGYKTMYCKKSQDIIYRKYRSDFEKFDYSREV